MDENIALSSEINSLNNNNNNEDDEISAMIDEINFNEILLSTNINENNFIKEISPSIKDQYSVPSINKVMKIYISNFYKNLIPKKCNYSLVTIFLRLLQVLGFISIIFGFILPNTLLKYHIILCIKTLVLWEYLENKCYISMIIQKLSNLNECPDFLPVDSLFSKRLVLILMLISILGVIFPELSFFKIFYKLFNSLKKYD